MRELKSNGQATPVFVACVWLLVGCGAQPPGRGETDLVLTIADPTQDFSLKRTFFAIEQVVELCEQPNGATSRPSDPSSQVCANLSHERDAALLAATKSGLVELGYQEVKARDEADLVLALGLVARKFWDLGQTYCFDEDPLKGCVSRLTTQNIQIPAGSLIIQLFDQVNSNEDVWKLSWVAAVDQRFAAGTALGLGGGSAEEDGDEAWVAGIQKAFGQSPELAEGKE